MDIKCLVLKPWPLRLSAAASIVWLLAGALLLCAVCILVIYLNIQLNSHVAVQRLSMNEAAYAAKAFFNRRVEFLKNLDKPVAAGSDRRSGSLSHLNRIGEPLPPTGLTLPLNDQLQAANLGVNLLLLLQGKDQLTVRRLESGFPIAEETPDNVLRQLSDNPTPLYQSATVWLFDPKDPQRRIYMARPFISPSSLDGGEQAWLVLEFLGRDVLASQQPFAGYEFALLDANEHEVAATAAASSGRTQDMWQRLSNALPIVPSVQTRFPLGPDWMLAYRYPESALLNDMRHAFLKCLAILSCVIAGLALGSLCVLNRFVRPALQRLQQHAEAEAFLRSVFNAAPVALCALRRRNGQAVLENQLARDWLPAIDPDWRSTEWVERVFLRARLQQVGVVSEELATLDGRHLFASLVPTRYRGEEVLLCALSDISLRKQAELALEHAKQLADAANAAKTAFIATMSHEIRTPLYGVFGNLELFKHTRLDPQQQGYVQAIQSSSTTLLGLINDVLDLSRIEAGQLRLEMETFNLFELAHEVVHGYAASALNKGVLIYACIDPRLSLPLRGDPGKVRQILSNLLSNAVKFTDNGRIVMRCGLVNGNNGSIRASIQIADTGIGIAAEDQASLFKLFFQVGEGRRRASGTGLGLPICQQLATLMGGDITVVSEPGLGSSFTLWLPLKALADSPPRQRPLTQQAIYVSAPVRELADSLCDWLNFLGGRALACARENLPRDKLCLEVRLDIDPHRRANWPGVRIWHGDESARSSAEWVSLYAPTVILDTMLSTQGLAPVTAAGAGASTPGNLNLRVLAVEDNDINRMVLKEQLETLGCRVQLAANGQEALQRWNVHEFDLVLTDISMPRMDGRELARRIHLQAPGFLVVGTTASILKEEAQLAREAGMAAVIIKPVSLSNLFRCLNSLKQRREYRELSSPGYLSSNGVV